MLRGRRLSSSSTGDKLWSLGLRMQGSTVSTGATSTVRSITTKTTRGILAASSSYQPHNHHQQHQHNHQHHYNWGQYQSFSTGTKGLVKEQTPTATITDDNTAKATAATDDIAATTRLAVDKDGNLLVSAAKEAQRLSDLASKSRLDRSNSDNTKQQEPAVTVAKADAVPPQSASPPLTSSSSSSATATTVSSTAPLDTTKRVITEETLENALEAAQALLFVTSRSTPLQDAIRHKQDATPDIHRQIACLHRAFVAVTSWCLDVAIMSKDPRILDKALAVADRAYQLQLPLHFPLYQRLIQTVAQEFDPNPEITSSSKTKTAAAASSSSIRHNQNVNNFRSRVTVAGLILEISSRATLSLSTAATATSPFYRDALVALAERRRYSDLSVLLRGMEVQYMIYDLDLDTLVHLLAVFQTQIAQDESLATGAGENWEQTVALVEVLNMLNPYVWKTFPAYSNLAKLVDSQKPKKVVSAKEDKVKKTDQVIPTTPSYQHDEDDEDEDDTNDTTTGEPKKKSSRRRRKNRKQYDSMYQYRKMIYHPSGDFGAIPDLKQQIATWSGGRGLRYSEAFEKDLFKQIEAELFDDDDDIFSLGQGYDRKLMEDICSALMGVDEIDAADNFTEEVDDFDHDDSEEFFSDEEEFDIEIDSDSDSEDDDDNKKK